jgi:hypothetical protein
MESTGQYWKPVYNLLELEGIETLVVNAQHIKNVPGRKTDVKDAGWIAGLLRHGLPLQFAFELKDTPINWKIFWGKRPYGMVTADQK